MKYFAVSTTGVVYSLTPLIACLLAACILKETLSLWTIGSVIIVLACVMMIIFGVEGEEAEALDAQTWAVIALCAQPFLLAGGMIAARRMKKNHPMAQTCYTNLLLGVVSVIGVCCYDHIDFSFIKDWSFLSWVLITLAGLFTIFENTAKFMAFRYEEAAKLQKLAFLPNVWNFVIDLIKGTHFGGLQLAGFISLFVFYTYELVSFYFCQPAKVESDTNPSQEAATTLGSKDEDYLAAEKVNKDNTVNTCSSSGQIELSEQINASSHHELSEPLTDTQRNGPL